MHIVDTALAERERTGNQIRVGIVGAGFMGRALSHQIIQHVPGMRLAAIGNRTVERAKQSYLEAGVQDVEIAANLEQLERCIDEGLPVITADSMLLAHARNLDCLVEITGTIEHGARIVLEAVLAGKHVILANAELDATIGPILKVYAQKSGVVISGCDGDQPGAELNLYRRVSAMGLRPLICGNIKGLQDYYRTPTTQKSFAERWGQNPYMVTSFADGTKISFEQAIVANATGMKVAQRGMLGYSHNGHIDDLIERYDVDMLRSLGGIVDYTLGSKPSPGVFVFAECIDSHQHKFLDYFKMGVGPLYSFYVPYHLCHMEMPFSIARAVLFNDATITPRDRPIVEVITIAKKSLKAGESLDRYGGYTTYGQCENAEIVAREHLLPIGLGEGCTLKRDVAQDEPLTWNDVELPSGSVSARLYAEQQAHFQATFIGK